MKCPGSACFLLYGHTTISMATVLGVYLGEGKITYTFSANANVLSANFPFSVLPAGGEGVGTF